MVTNATWRLTKKKEYFRSFDSLDHWITAETEITADNELEFFTYIKVYVLQTYRLKDIFIAPSVLDELVYYVICNYDAPQVIPAINNFIIQSGLNKNSVVILPLHSFGFKNAGLIHLKSKIIDVFFEDKDFRIYPQTNSLKKTKAAILRYLEDHKIANLKKLDKTLLDHFFFSRNLKWLERNPFLLFHFKFSQEERFDNLHYILEKFKFITAKLYFISVLSENSDNNSMLSTSITNNWETLNVRHFITISISKNRADVNCLPVHFGNLMVFDIIHMNIELDFPMKRGKKWMKDAISCMDKIYLGYLKYTIKKQTEDLKYYRLANSLKYFRRSIKSLQDEDKIINLNTAIEILLLDDFENKKKELILQRLWLIFKRKRQERKRDINIKFSDLILERNRIIHSGLPVSNKPDYKYLYKVYCKLILNFTKDLSMIDSTQNKYITNYCNKL